MSIYHPVQESDESVFVGNNAFTNRCEIEGHLVVTLDVHEAGVSLQQRVQDWSMLEVSVESLEAPITCVNVVR